MNYDPKLLEAINQIVDFNIRPALNADGGDISVVSLDGNTLFVKLHGACSNCPNASATLQGAVQSTLQKMVSADLKVRAV